MNYIKPTQTSQTKNNPTSRVSLRSQFYQVKLACDTTYQLQDIEATGLSYIPCSHEQPILKFAHLWDSALQVNLDSYGDEAHRRKLSGMKGIQIMTGKPTKRLNGEILEHLIVLDIESRLFTEYPDIAGEIRDIYLSACHGSPCIIESKSEGLHLYAYCEYFDKKRSFKNRDGKMLLEFLSQKCLSRVDDRYRIKEGDLLNIPSIDKSALQQIHQLLSTIAPQETTSNTPSRIVETVEIGDLHLDFNSEGKSQYLPLSQCLSEIEHTGDQTRESVRYTQGHGELIGFCFNCEHEWRVPQSDVPQPPPPDTDQPPSYRHFTKELRAVSTKVLSIPSTNGWQPRLEPLHSHPQIEPPNRRIYAPNEAVECEKCGHSHAVPSIDRCTLTAHHLCQHCGHDRAKGSYLKYELDRKLKNAIISDHTGYPATDTLLKEESLWTKGRWFHLAAPMGAGKTTLIYHRAREAAETGAITIIVVPRVSLATAVFNQLREDTTLGWGLFYEGSETDKPKSQKWTIGQLGAVCTFGVLPHLIKKLKDEKRPIRIFIDEVDFGFSLLLANIFKGMATEVKETLCNIIQKHGIVTAGQTASTLAIEAITAELGIDPENVTGYYMPPRPVKQDAALYMVDIATADNTKNRLVQAVIDGVRDVLARGKNAYVFCDERITAEIVHSFFDSQSLLYDAYHRGDPENEELLRLQDLPEGKRVFVASNAVDVGISIRDDNAETIVLCTGNPLSITPLASTAQKCVRNRSIPPLRIYFLDYQNALPLSPEQAIDFQTAYAKQTLRDEPVPDSLVELIGVKEALETLAADQPADFLSHHLGQAGYELKLEDLDLGTFDFQQVKDRRKQIKDREKAETIERAASILYPEQMLTDSEIRRRNWEDSQPAPYNQLAHERAAKILQHCGWNGEVERFEETTDRDRFRKGSVEAFRDAGVTDAMWATARNAVHLDPKKIEAWKRAYLGVHYPDAVYAEYETGRQGEFHHRPDDRLIGKLMTELLERLPREPSTLEAVGQALIDAAQVRYGNDTLSALMKDGSMGLAMAKRVRVIDLGRDAEPDEAHFECVKGFISEHYPARIAKIGDRYQLATPRNEDDVKMFKEVVRCYIKHRHPDIDSDEPNNSDLTPPPASDPSADIKKKASDLRKNGLSCRQAAKACNKSKSWVAKYAESPPNPHSDRMVASTELSTQIPINKTHPRKRVDTITENGAKTASEPAPLQDGCIPVTDQIRQFFDGNSGLEIKTNEIHDAIDAPEGTIKSALSRLVKAGELERVKGHHGVHKLPHTVSVDPSPVDSISSALTPATLPAGLEVSELLQCVIEHVLNQHDIEIPFSMAPSDIHRLMRDHPDQLAVPPFLSTSGALNAIVEYRWTRVRDLAFDILCNPEKYEELLGPFVDRFVGNRGRADPAVFKLALLEALRTWAGESWVESLQPKINFNDSRISLFKYEHFAEASLAEIQGGWNFACRNEALVMHPIVPFVERRMLFG